MTKHKHLTLSDRNDIQLGLEHGETFKAIGQSILKDPTTVSKEVKRNRQVRESTCHNLPCPLLDKAPFVCNGCPKRRQNCGFKKIFYLAKQAQKQYEQTLVESREGTPLNSKTFWDTWTKSFLMRLKRDNTSIISSKLITLMSAPQPSIDTSEKDTYLSLRLILPEPLNSKKEEAAPTSNFYNILFKFMSHTVYHETRKLWIQLKPHFWFES